MTAGGGVQQCSRNLKIAPYRPIFLRLGSHLLRLPVDIPDSFKSQEHRIEYLEIFERKLELYYDLVCLVLYKVYGPNFSFQNLDGTTLSLVNDMTNSISYLALSAFEHKHPEYKTSMDYYIPRDAIKDAVFEAFKSASEGDK